MHPWFVIDLFKIPWSLPKYYQEQNVSFWQMVFEPVSLYRCTAHLCIYLDSSIGLLLLMGHLVHGISNIQSAVINPRMGTSVNTVKISFRLETGL